MVEEQKKFVVGIDLGAGFGAKLGLFRNSLDLVCTRRLPLSDIDKNSEDLVSGLCNKVEEMLNEKGLACEDVAALGLACAGIFRSNGSFEK